MRFVFTKEVFELGVRGVYFNIFGMQNRASSDPAVEAFVDARIEKMPPELENSPVLKGFEELHAAVSSKAQKLVSAPAGLLSFYRNRGDIPRINGIVDVYNAVSISTGIAVGAHDLKHVEGDIALRLTKGDENFHPLGSQTPGRVSAGEYAYVDGRGDILCRLEVRQGDKTKITPESSDVFFIVQGHASADPAVTQNAAKDLIAACTEIFGGTVEQLYP